MVLNSRSDGTSWCGPSIYFALVVLAVVINWPGRANPDTVDMLYQATHLEALNQWHSPVITFLYGLAGPVFGYPGGGLIIQSALMMIWPAYLLTRMLRFRGSYVLQGTGLVLAGLLTFVFLALSGQVIKDVLMVALMSPAFAIISHLRDRRLNQATPALLLALFFLTTAFLLIRPSNHLILLFSLAALLCVATPAKPRFIAASLGGFVATVLLGLLALGGSRAVLPSKEAHPELSLLFFDLAGISTELKSDLFATLPNWTPLPSLRPWDCYAGLQGDPFLWGECKEYRALARAHPAEIRQLWMNQIVAHPVAYLKHRALYTRNLLIRTGRGTDVIMPAPPDFSLVTNAVPHIDAMPERMRTGIQLWHPQVGYVPFGTIAHFWFSQFTGSPILWVATATAGLLLGAVFLRRRGDYRLLIVSSIGVGNFLTLSLFAPSDDLRYLLPTMMSALAAIVLIIEWYWAPLSDSPPNRTTSTALPNQQA